MADTLTPHDSEHEAGGEEPGSAQLRRQQRRSRAALLLWVGVLGVFVVFAIFGPWLAPFEFDQSNLDAVLEPPGATSEQGTHLLGTDQLGRDLFSRIIIASRLSLLIGVVATAIGGIIGVLVGLAGGYAGGWVDRLAMRAAEAQIAIPNFLLAIFLLAILGSSVINLFIVLPLFVWPVYARIMRGEALILRQSPFIEAARATGCSNLRIIGRHLVPNVASRIAVVSVIELGHTILSEAMLSFIGLGVQPPDTTWGLLVSQGRDYLAVAWWLVALPGLALFLTVLSVNMISRIYSTRLGTAG